MNNRVIVVTKDRNTVITHKPEGVEVEVQFVKSNGDEDMNILHKIDESWPTPEAKSSAYPLSEAESIANAIDDGVEKANL